jgi:hypothetical protein
MTQRCRVAYALTSAQQDAILESRSEIPNGESDTRCWYLPSTDVWQLEENCRTENHRKLYRASVAAIFWDGSPRVLFLASHPGRLKHTQGSSSTTSSA